MAAPANDDVAAAEAFEPGDAITGTTVEATSDVDEQGVYGPSVRTVYYLWENDTGTDVPFTIPTVTAGFAMFVAAWLIDHAPVDSADLFMNGGGLFDIYVDGDPVSGVVPAGSFLVLQIHADGGDEGGFAFGTSPDPLVDIASGAVTIHLADLLYDEHVDISEIALTLRVVVRHNGPRTAVVEVPSGSALVTGLFADDLPAMRKGNRKLLVWDEGSVTDDNPTGIVFHGRVFTVERTGDGLNNRAVITAIQPLWSETGFESEDRAGRPVRDETGNFSFPTFDSPITGAELVFQILTNSQQTGPESDPTPGEGPLPIDLTTGTFSSTDDLSPEDDMSWPKMIGDFLRQIVDANVIDIIERPVDPSEGLDPYAMTAVSVVDLAGSDRSAAVHFDYWTGSFNAKTARHVEDFTTICNKLYDYLGPKQLHSDGTDWLGHWAGNITPGTSGTTVDPTDSRDRYGQFMQIRIFDSNKIENSAPIRPLYITLWNAEMGLRVEPRDMLFVTPNPGGYALFQPFGKHYDVGDLIAVNVGGDFGVNIAAVQRVYGYDVEWDRDGVKRVSGLLVSADAA